MTLIIAEAGVNHNGNLTLAKHLINIAAHCKADAIKFQTYKTSKLMFSDNPMYDTLKRLELTDNETIELSKHAKKQNITFLSTPFDEQSVNLLVKLKVPFIKISSGDLTHHPLLEHIAKTGIPVLLSTGMSTCSEITKAIKVLNDNGCVNITLMQCTSAYPTQIQDANISVIPKLKNHFRLPVGYSDHTTSPYAAYAAVAVGVTVIEKHFTLDKNLDGPDHAMSANPIELKELVTGIRKIELAMGNGQKHVLPSEYMVRRNSRRSIYAKKDIMKNTIITKDMLVCKRPGGAGYQPSFVKYFTGKLAKVHINKNSIIDYSMLENKK